MDPMELSSLNELLDCITALGVATDYDQIGLKPDQREIESPPVTHQIAVVEGQCDDSSPMLRRNYVQISELTEPDTHPREGMPHFPNLEVWLVGCCPMNPARCLTLGSWFDQCPFLRGNPAWRDQESGRNWSLT